MKFLESRTLERRNQAAAWSRLIPPVAAALGVLALPVILAAQSGMDPSSGGRRSAASDALDFTINVTVSDTQIEPSVVFVPAGRPVQLLLRNRCSSEHHYRVVGLEPDEIAWLADPTPAGEAEHDHHSRRVAGHRAASPAGIRPTGHEVHAWALPRHRPDAVLFTATETGTYIVQCDLHQHKGARLTVFAAQEARPAVVRVRETR